MLINLVHCRDKTAEYEGVGLIVVDGWVGQHDCSRFSSVGIPYHSSNKPMEWDVAAGGNLVRALHRWSFCPIYDMRMGPFAKYNGWHGKMGSVLRFVLISVGNMRPRNTRASCSINDPSCHRAPHQRTQPVPVTRRIAIPSPSRPAAIPRTASDFRSRTIFKHTRTREVEARHEPPPNKALGDSG